MNTLGDDLTSFFRAAQHSALIVAPFIRSEALGRILGSIPVGAQITIVTRWRPVDLVMGASDLGVYELAESRGAALYLRHDLHAKIFAADDRCLVGSPNVTLTALGWRTPANLELLTPVARTADHIAAFESGLFSSVIRASEEQRDRLRELLEKLEGLPILRAPNTDHTSMRSLLPLDWFPRVRNPEELYSVYCGDHDVSRLALHGMQEELAQIEIIPGMDEEGFRAWVAATIRHVPIVDGVIARIEAEGQVTEGAVGDLLAGIGIDADEYRPRDVLEVLQRWLTYFLPGKYETVQESVRLIRSRDL